jgi:hypothetical protein
MKPYNFPNVITANQVLNASFFSQAMQLYSSYNFSIQVVFTGTPTGTFFLQASADPMYSGYPGGSTAPATPTNWSTIADSDFVVSAAGDCFWNYSYPGFNWVRIGYTDGSAGASTAVVTSSVINIKGS